MLRRSGHRVIGVDAAETMVRHARDTGAYERVLSAPASSVPLPDSAADLVVAYMSLHDMDDLAGTLGEVARLLEPGGCLCAAVVHPIASARLAARYSDVVRYAEPHPEPGLGIVFHGVHRPLAAYVGALVDAGLTLDALGEPVPDAAAVAAHPPLVKALAAPPFLHLRATRR
jgi:SAM-dependent methyltransferase